MSRTRRGSWAGRVTAGTVVAVWLPVVCFAVLAWHHRWVSDDGFINLRIVWNVLHGDGPVFNAGERVEAGTSPLWIAILVVARVLLWFLDPAWTAVLAGIALTLAGIAFAAAGARRWWASIGRDAPLPLGALLLVALPPMWDFASSGLETGLSFAWIGACWWAVARRLDPHRNLDRDGAIATTSVEISGWAAGLIGLGPLIRPDFVVFSVAFAVALVATSRLSRRANLRALGLGLAAPLLYQVFRMGYYGLLVPNTALAKEAGRSLWSRGWTYLDVYVGSTLLLIPLGLLAVLILLEAPTAGPARRHAIVAAAPVVAALINGIYVVKVGGDFMYARLFLPATFALVCPVAAFPLPSRRRLVAWAGVGALATTLVLIGGFRRWDPVDITDDPTTAAVDGDLSVDGIANERLVWMLLAGDERPVTYDDYATYVESGLVQLGELPREGQLVDLGGSGRYARSDRPLLVGGSIGLVGYKFLGTHVIDQLSLAEPLGAHMEAGPPSRPGHEKILGWEWLVARFAQPSVDEPVVDDARAALACGDLVDLVDAVDAPLTPGRFLRNVVGSVSRTQLRVPPIPAEARLELCG